MSAERVTDAVATALNALLWVLGITIVGGSAAIILTMDASAASQGGRYYVAIAALIALAFVDRQMMSVVRRRLPWSIGTRPGERRYQLRSYLLFVVASLFLLGLAHYKTVGASSGLAQLLGYGLLLGLSPFVVALVLNRFIRKPFEHGIDVLFGVSQDNRERAFRRGTFSFSFGSPSMQADDDRGSRPLTLSAYQVTQYREDWQRIQLSFEADPADAVRRAHRLLLELCTSAGRSGAFTRHEHFVTSTLSGVGSVLDVSRGRVEEARSVQVAVQAALAGESAKREDLARAMVEYERMLKQLLDG